MKDTGYGTVTNQTCSAQKPLQLSLQFKDTQRTANSAINIGVTNIKLIRPQYAPNGQKWWDSPTQEFTTAFLNSFKGVSTMRYMNWTQPLNTPEVN